MKTQAGVTFTPRNQSKPQFSKILSAPARQSLESPSSSDREEFQDPTLQKTPMKLSVQPKRERDNEYENEADDKFRPSSQQVFQPEHHGLEENFFDKDKDAFISDYQSDPKPIRDHTYLAEKRIDLEIVKKKNQNLDLENGMKRTHTLSGLEESSIPIRSRSIKRLKKEKIYYSTYYANIRSFCHQNESGSED